MTLLCLNFTEFDVFELGEFGVSEFNEYVVLSGFDGF